MSDLAGVLDALGVAAILVAALGLWRGRKRLPRGDIPALLAGVLALMALQNLCSVLEWHRTALWLRQTAAGAGLLLPFFWAHFLYSFGQCAARREAESALRRARDEAQNYLDVAGVILIALDLEGRVTMVNRKGCAVLGRSEEELTGRDWFESCVPAESHEEVRAVFERLVGSGGRLEEHSENPILTRDGERRHVAWHNALLRDEEGRVTGVLSSGEDITARKRAEEALVRSEERFRLLVETSLDGISICELDPETNARRLVFCNDRFVDMSGYSREELAACEDLNELVSDMSDRDGPRGSRMHEPSGQPYFGMASWKRPDGQENVHEWAVTCVESDGKCLLFGFDRDVTERQQARRALQASEERYRSTIDAMGDAVIVIDRDFRIVLANHAGEDIAHESGWTGKLVGRGLFEVMSFLPDELRRQYESTFEQGTVLVTEPTHTIGGREMTLEVRKIPMVEGGEVARILTLVRDVTARKQAEAALEKSESEKAALLNAMSEAVIFYDTDMRLLWANRAASGIFGSDPLVQVGKTCHQLWFGTDSECAGCELADAVAMGDAQEAEVRAPDGAGWWHVNRYPVLDGQGQLRGVVDVALDITERKRSEDALAQWAAVAESTDDAIVATLLDGTIVRWNPGAARIYGYSAAEALGTCILRFAPEERRDNMRRILSNVAQGERVQQYETANLTREGDLINVAFTMSPMLDDGGRVTGVSVIARDITEHVKLREELINLSLVDALTGLNNRRGFFHLASQQFKIARRTQNAALLIFADVDDMKWINDSLGHKAGDRALVDAADVLRKTFREADIIGRIGGDEFAVLAVEAEAVNPRDILARLQLRLDARNADDERRFKLSLSVGLVDCRPDEPIAFDDMMAEADARMYEHKRSKKARRIPSPDPL